VPVITVKVFEGDLTKGQTAELIDDVTNAVIPFVGEASRAGSRRSRDERYRTGLRSTNRRRPYRKVGQQLLELDYLARAVADGFTAIQTGASRGTLTV
jgi:tautomerase-like protein